MRIVLLDGHPANARSIHFLEVLGIDSDDWRDPEFNIFNEAVEAYRLKTGVWRMIPVVETSSDGLYTSARFLVEPLMSAANPLWRERAAKEMAGTYRFWGWLHISDISSFGEMRDTRIFCVVGEDLSEFIEEALRVTA